MTTAYLVAGIVLMLGVALIALADWIDRRYDRSKDYGRREDPKFFCLVLVGCLFVVAPVLFFLGAVLYWIVRTLA